MSIPFVYSLSFRNPKTGSNHWYIGVKYGKNSHPSDLWKSYFSSSKVIQQLLVEYGSSSFKAKIVKTFQDEKSARAYEEKLIRRAIKFGLRLNCELINKGIPNTNFANSMKGRKFEEIFSPEVCEKLKKILSQPKSKESILKMKETRIKNGTYFTGSAHKMARKFKLISPSSEEFIVEGALKKFCAEHDLSWQTLYSHIGKGIIPKEPDRTKYKNLKRLSSKFWNTLGWSIIAI